MRVPAHWANKAKRGGLADRSAFTLVELLVASAAAGLATASAVMFMSFANTTVSGIMAQSMVNDSAGNAVLRMRSRIRVATSIATDTTGNKLTLGFDDDYATDSNGDGRTYNDQDHYETFQFVGTNGSNATKAGSNRMVYTPRVGVNASTVLMHFGVRNLPGKNIFEVPYPGMVIIRFGVVDPNSRNRFQSIDIQATGVSLNRPASSSVISIYP